MAEEKTPAVEEAKPEFHLVEVGGWTPVAACPVCGDQSQFESFVSSVQPTRPTTVWTICNGCGHVFCNPQPSPEWLAGFYKEGYRKMTHGVKVESSKGVPRASGEEEMARGARVITLIDRFIALDGLPNCLDIGCSTGALLAGLLNKFSCKYAVGVEPNDAWRTFAEESYVSFMLRAKELNIEGSQLLMFKSLDEVPRDKRFDLVSIIHVLEHIDDPLTVLKTVKEHYLKDNGFVVVAVPNLIGGMPDPLMFPHLHAFRRETIIKLVENAGLHVLLYETGDTVQPFWIAAQDLWVIASLNPLKAGNKTEILRLYNNQRSAVNRVREARKNVVPTYTMG